MESAEDYEKFVVEVLKPQLTTLMKSNEEVEEEIVGYDKIEEILTLKDKKSDGVEENDRKNEKTLEDYLSSLTVDIGEDCLIQAEVSDKTLQEVYLHVGMGFHVALPREEALPTIRKRKELLVLKKEQLQKKIEEVAAYIQEILPIVEELQRIRKIESK